MKKVCLNTERMLDEANPQDDDYNLWKKVYELMNGEDAFVYESSIEKGKWIFCGLVDGKKNKDLFYLIEQDSMIGRYIGDWEEFETDWESGAYEPDGCIYLDFGCGWNYRIFNLRCNGRYPAKDGYFWRVGAWCGDCGRRRNDA